MKIDFDRVIQKAKPYGIPAFSIVVPSEDVPLFLACCEDCGYLWNGGSKPTEFNPADEYSSADFIEVHFSVSRTLPLRIRLAYDAWFRMPELNKPGRYLLEEILIPEEAAPLDLSRIFPMEVLP